MTFRTNASFWSRLTFFLLLINSQAFFTNVFNPIGIPGLLEAFLVFLLIFAARALMKDALIHRFRVPDMIVLLIAFGFWFGSATMAFLQHGQPIIFGLIEDRRILNILVYFPLITLIRRDLVSTEEIVSHIIKIAWFCVFLGLLLKYNLLPTIKTIQVAASNSRADRVSVGLSYIAIACFAYAISWVRTGRQRKIYFSFLLLFAILFVGQVRQITLAVALCGFILIHKRLGRFMIPIGTILVLGLIGILVFPDVIDKIYAKYADLFGQLTSDNYLEESARAVGIKIILTEIPKFDYFGGGALWLQWQNGFARLYGENFYLSDVGIFGTYYRFGVLAIPMMMAVLYFVYRRVMKMPPSAMKSICLSGVLFMTILLPTAGFVEYRGFMVGMLLALAVGRVHEERERIIERMTLRSV